MQQKRPESTTGKWSETRTEVADTVSIVSETQDWIFRDMKVLICQSHLDQFQEETGPDF